jgi:hypothetical protein
VGVISLLSPFRLRHLLADKFGNSVEWYECDPTLFSALSKPNQPPITAVLALIIEAPRQAEKWIAAGRRKAEKFRP